MEKLEKKVSIIILIVVVAASLFLTLVGFISDFMWFKEMGYVSVFFTQLVTQLKVGIPTFIIVTGLVMLYLHHLRKSYFAKIASSEATDMKKLNRTTNWLAVAFGVVATVMSVTNLWFEILKFANSTDFDITDPLFSFDISFYLFKLEFLSQLNEILIGVIVGFVILTIVYYIILMTVRTPDVFKEEPVQGAETAEDSEERYTGNANPFGGNPFGDNPFGGNNANNAKDPFSKIFESLTGKKVNARPIKPKKQFDDGNFRQLMNIASGKITILGFIFFIMLAINFFLRQFDLLHAHTGVVYGAGFTDVNITLWMYRILCGLAILSAIMFIVQMGRKKYKSLLTVPVIMIFVGLVGTGAGMLIQNFVVSPDEINKESQYLERNIQYTQYAYQLDDVDIKAFAADNKLTDSDINANVETINNIRINDFDPAQQFYNQTQSIRQYYTFHDVDVDRYMINGKYTQTFLTAREIDENKIDTSWLNRHLKYTHGYGATLSRVDKVTSSGQPDVLIGNIPPESEVKEIEITRPEIYFGELSNEYIVVNTDEKEFDYPDGQSNKYTMYEGKAGIKLNFFNRVLFSIKEGSLKLLVSSNIDSNSKIIIYRNVIERLCHTFPMRQIHIWLR